MSRANPEEEIVEPAEGEGGQETERTFGQKLAELRRAESIPPNVRERLIEAIGKLTVAKGVVKGEDEKRFADFGAGPDTEWGAPYTSKDLEEGSVPGVVLRLKDRDGRYYWETGVRFKWKDGGGSSDTLSVWEDSAEFKQVPVYSELASAGHPAEQPAEEQSRSESAAVQPEAAEEDYFAQWGEAGRPIAQWTDVRRPKAETEELPGVQKVAEEMAGAIQEVLDNRKAWQVGAVILLDNTELVNTYFGGGGIRRGELEGIKGDLNETLDREVRDSLTGIRASVESELVFTGDGKEGGIAEAAEAKAKKLKAFEELRDRVASGDPEAIQQVLGEKLRFLQEKMREIFERVISKAERALQAGQRETRRTTSEMLAVEEIWQTQKRLGFKLGSFGKNYIPAPDAQDYIRMDESETDLRRLIGCVAVFAGGEAKVREQ